MKLSELAKKVPAEVPAITRDDAVAILKGLKEPEAAEGAADDDGDYTADTTEQDLIDALSLLDDAKDVLEHLATCRVTGGAEMRVPRHLQAEMLRTLDDIELFITKIDLTALGE